LDPPFKLEENAQIICSEGSTTKLLADLVTHQVDVILSDAPIPPGVKVRAFNHVLGESGVLIMGSSHLVKSTLSGFPNSLNRQPFLLPARGTLLRRDLEKWFADFEITPVVVGEFDDSALLKVFGQDGSGFFAVPTVIEEEVCQQYGVVRVGETNIVERYYAISVNRKVKNPAVEAICHAARHVFVPKTEPREDIDSCLGLSFHPG